MTLFSRLVIYRCISQSFHRAHCTFPRVWVRCEIDKGKSTEISLDNSKKSLQNSCFHKIPAILIGNTIGSSQEALTTANPTLTVCLDCNPDLNLKHSEPRILIQAVCPHIYSPEIYYTPLPFPKTVFRECQMRDSVADCKPSSSFSCRQMHDSNSDLGANSRQHGLPEHILLSIAGKMGESSCIWHTVQWPLHL